MKKNDYSAGYDHRPIEMICTFLCTETTIDSLGNILLIHPTLYIGGLGLKPSVNAIFINFSLMLNVKLSHLNWFVYAMVSFTLISVSRRILIH